MSKPKTSNQAAGISTLIEQILASKGLNKKLQQYRAWTVWDEVVGPQIARHAQPLRIRESILEVRVENPTWMQQLQLLKPKILKELNQRLGESTLSDIYWKQGEIKKDKLPKVNSIQKKAMSATVVPKGVFDALPEIDDDELMNVIKQVLKRDYMSK